MFAFGQRKEILVAVVLALLPGFAALRRGNRRQALALAALMLTGAALVPFTWNTAFITWPVLMMQSAVLSAAITEAYHRHAFPRPYNALLAGALVLSMLGAGRVAFDLTIQQIWHPTVVPTTPTVSGGWYLTRPLTTPAHHLMVVTTGDQGFAQGADVIAPIVALPGETVEGRQGNVMVNGIPTTVQPFNSRVATTANLEPLVVPPDHVVLYAHPLKPVPMTAVRELFFQWRPTAERAPADWQPSPALEIPDDPR